MTDRTVSTEAEFAKTAFDEAAFAETVIGAGTAPEQAVGAAEYAPPADERIEQLREWLEQRYPEAELTEDSDLTDGVVEDSLAFVELLVLVEDLRGAPIPAADVDLENFRTLRTIAARFFDTAPGDGQ